MNLRITTKLIKQLNEVLTSHNNTKYEYKIYKYSRIGNILFVHYKGFYNGTMYSVGIKYINLKTLEVINTRNTYRNDKFIELCKQFRIKKLSYVKNTIIKGI